MTTYGDRKNKPSLYPQRVDKIGSTACVLLSWTSGRFKKKTVESKKTKLKETFFPLRK